MHDFKSLENTDLSYAASNKIHSGTTTCLKCLLYVYFIASAGYRRGSATCYYSIGLQCKLLCNKAEDSHFDWGASVLHS